MKSHHPCTCNGRGKCWHCRQRRQKRQSDKAKLIVVGVILLILYTIGTARADSTPMATPPPTPDPISPCFAGSTKCAFLPLLSR